MAVPKRKEPPETRISEADYLAGEAIAAVKHEFVDGVVTAMAGASLRHADILSNLARKLLGLTGVCRVRFNDVKVRFEDDLALVYFYPDLVVSCEPETARDHVTKPVLIIEVLSPTTEAIDRSKKFVFYSRIPSLKEYVLVSQETRRVEFYRARTQWMQEVVVPEDEVTFESVELAMTFDELYRDIDLSQPLQAGA